MLMRIIFLWALLTSTLACQAQQKSEPTKGKAAAGKEQPSVFEGFNGEKLAKVVKSEEEWKKILTPEEYNVLRKAGTERAFTGEYNKHKAQGIYACRGCNLPLFSSEAKYESGSGWPSFYQPFIQANVWEKEDRAYGMVRVEVLCARCGGHLGHVFDDGPKPTGLRYCMNSVSLKFVPSAKGQ